MATEKRDIRIAEEGLLLEEPLLRKAHLGRHVRIVVQKGGIRILPAEEDWEKMLDELAGCLGEEPAQNYDFNWALSSQQDLVCGRKWSGATAGALVASVLDRAMAHGKSGGERQWLL